MALRKMWFLVAHRAGARLFSTDWKGHVGFERMWDFPGGHLRNQDINADKSGSSSRSVGSRHGILSQEHDPVDHESSKTAALLARELESLHEKDHECRIGLVAEPRFLGKLKDSLNASTLKAVARTITKDLAKISNEDVCLRIKEEMEKDPLLI